MNRFSDWVRVFLKENPTTGLDAKYSKLIAENIDAKVVHDVRFMLADDLKTNWNLLFWLRNRNKYRLTFSNIFIALVLALALKIKK